MAHTVAAENQTRFGASRTTCCRQLHYKIKYTVAAGYANSVCRCVATQLETRLQSNKRSKRNRIVITSLYSKHGKQQQPCFQLGLQSCQWTIQPLFKLVLGTNPRCGYSSLHEDRWYRALTTNASTDDLLAECTSLKNLCRKIDSSQKSHLSIISYMKTLQMCVRSI